MLITVDAGGHLQRHRTKTECDRAMRQGLARISPEMARMVTMLASRKDDTADNHSKQET